MRGDVAFVFLVACGPKVDVGAVAARARMEAVSVEVLAGPELILEASFPAGSSFDPPGQAGVGSVLAHALVVGGAGERSASDVRAVLFADAVDRQVVVDRETAKVRLVCPLSRAAMCSELLADALLAPGFEPRTVDTIRNQHRVRLGDARTDPEMASRALFSRGAYGVHPHAHAVEGALGPLEVLSPAMVRAHYRRTVRRDSVRLRVTGPAEVTSGLLESLDDLANSLPVGPSQDRPLPDPPRGGRVLTMDVAGAFTGITIGGACDASLPAVQARLASLAGLPSAAEVNASQTGWSVSLPLAAQGTEAAALTDLLEGLGTLARGDTSGACLSRSNWVLAIAGPAVEDLVLADVYEKVGTVSRVNVEDVIR